MGPAVTFRFSVFIYFSTQPVGFFSPPLLIKSGPSASEAYAASRKQGEGSFQSSGSSTAAVKMSLVLPRPSDPTEMWALVS